MTDEFFKRSKIFRELLSAQINPYLALVIGHRAESPLPGPPHVATQLQEAALAALEQWDEKFGAMYAQVSFLSPAPSTAGQCSCKGSVLLLQKRATHGLQEKYGVLGFGIGLCASV